MTAAATSVEMKRASSLEERKNFPEEGRFVGREEGVTES
jgi:hypothetical protein